MPWSLRCGLSCICCEAKEPFLFSITFTLNNAIAIAIINTVNRIISIIFLKFAVIRPYDLYLGKQLSFCKAHANERNVSSLTNCRMQLSLCKGKYFFKKNPQNYINNE
ncbi:hypothetical protein HMPREF0658_0979 [Hoylesella marshii DSM 16973 = JCM 13450]|uniref:Uncharacterized protein n=1 Tax=Hoylesella marshii DSM 16973 = JCM 13450 TaxID=862515 RepID=E0NS28_9BACT|nr:hypothetical protein HMPREF0658_0979 [Hoylesella marshii DSM 16973 = JCM 13450]